MNISIVRCTSTITGDGQLQEKRMLLAAYRAGIKRVILPKATERDLQNIPEDVRNEPTFVQVETVEEILKRGAGGAVLYRCRTSEHGENISP